MNDSLFEIILELQAKMKEGPYWDFKEEHHRNKAKLLHDILCLSNSIQHKGPRYLVFGITDPPNCEIKGVIEDSNRITQAELLDWFSKIPFSGDLRPDISLETITINGFLIDILIVEDTPFKPFVLSEIYQDKEKIASKSAADEKNTRSIVNIPAGAVFSRVGDKNTAKDKTADLYHVEKMWRQRFGLDLWPQSRLQQYLLDFNNWNWDGFKNAYYEPFPEFTLEINLDDERLAGHWWSVFLGEYTMSRNVFFRYHSTLLTAVITCSFKEKKSIFLIHFQRMYVTTI